MRLRSIARILVKDIPRDISVSRARKLAVKELALRWSSPPSALAHGLGTELIVSLTSYRKRFPTLIHTLKCLLTQTVKADRIVLWISHEDEKLLPTEVRKLVGTSKFEFRTTVDLRSYTKIIPALKAFPNAYIATADDDTYYAADWLERMASAATPGRAQIVCHRAHGMRVQGGRPAPYLKWKFGSNTFEDTLLFPTGVGGVMYSPGSLGERVFEEDLFMRICPTGDDIWLAWAGHLNQAHYVKLWNKAARPVIWEGCNDDGLLMHNIVSGGNDVQLAAIVDSLGMIRRGEYEVR